MKKFILPIAILFLFINFRPSSGQPVHYSTANAHSHNDYEQALPFYDAYARHFGSIEADLWAMDGKLYVAHNQQEISPNRTFRALYLDPLIHRIEINQGKAYKDGQPLQLLIDLKSPYYKVLPLLTRELQPYKKYFGREHNPQAIRIVISGNMPPPDSLHFFDSIFTFDGRLGSHYPEKDLRQVVLVSTNVQNLVSWKADEPLSKSGQLILHRVIDSIHQKNKLIRFWATPNTNKAYQMLIKLGVDYIGTDDLPRLECLLRGRIVPSRQ